MVIEYMAALERILIVLVAGFFAYLGFRLYILGVTKGSSKVEAKTALGGFVMSGTGPGLLFMAFGGAILVYTLATSGVKIRTSEQSEASMKMVEIESSAPAISSQ